MCYFGVTVSGGTKRSKAHCRAVSAVPAPNATPIAMHTDTPITGNINYMEHQASLTCGDPASSSAMTIVHMT